MSSESGTGEAKPEQGEVKAFLDEPDKHQRVKEGWRPYLEAKLGFRNHWYPALFAYALTGDEPKAVKMLGERLILRRVDGRVYALEDRCAHRSFPLSRGTIDGDTVVCGYHGARYGADGRCRQVPSQAQVPPGAVVVPRWEGSRVKQ